MSQSPAMSDESDFYGSDEEVEVQVQTRSQIENAALDNDVESPGSDAMLMDESPPESPPASLPAIIAPTTIPPASPERSAVKRKLSPVEHEPEVVQKRQKVTTIPEQYYASTVPRTAGLPAEIWQHVFLYLTPDSLSCCLRVNKAFHSYLSSTAATMSIRLPSRKGGMQRTGLKLIDSEAIWTSARKLFAPNLPRPLSGFSEMQMFQLLGGKYCQRCGDPPTGPVNARTPFDAGPGVHGVRIIWSFSARLCGRCFDASAAKDTEILQSPAAPLRAGLAHAFRTNDLHYIPATTLQTNPGGAPRGQMFKVYYHKHILDLQREYEDAKEFGEAAAEEWVKGLPLNGKQQMADAARWERWEALQPPGTHPAKTLREYFRPISAPIPALASPAPVSEVTLAAASAVSASVPPSNGSSLPVLSSQPMKHPLPARVVAVTQPASVAPSTVQSSPQSGVPAQNGTNLQNSLPSPHYIPPHHTLPPPPQQSLSQHQQAPTYRPPRNPKEVEEARAARKADIERRCYEEFFPPLLPNVLQHMESFRAAMAMVMPLTDQAWEVLKPRLYMQRDAAEQIEYQRAEQLRALQATIPDPSYRETYSKTANDAAERQWEQQQGPVRKKLGKLADEFIRLKWNNGKGLSRDTAPAFAVEVLLYARNKFVEKNTPKDQVVKEGPRDPRDPAFVSLENMRWLFDNKVKNITERHCRELFMCAECEGVTKGYAFEGMIQHFGAKHTDSFSQGNIVVHWQTADWPDDPPFVPTIGDADPTLPAKHPAPLVASTADAGSYGSSQAYVPPVPGALPNLAPGQLEQLYAALNPQSSQMAAPPTPAYPPRSYGQGASYQPVTTAAPPSVPQFGGAVNIYQDQLNEIAKVARETWDALSRVKDMEESIRVETVLHHVIARFKARYASEPSLDLITDALANHILMRPIKSAHPLACKTCVSASLGMTAYKPYHHRLADHKLYNISSLITHFKTVHLVGQDACAVDWKEDMIEMADEAQIKQLVSAVGMDDERLAIIAPAFPGIFSYPLPRIGRIEELTQDSDDSPRNYNKFNKKDRTRNKNKRLPRNARAVLDHDEDEQSDLPEAGEDEYDPRRPAFIEGPAGRTRSSVSGARRSLGGQTGNGQTPASILTPETIAALSKLAPTLNLNPAAVLGRRSPSFPTVAPAAQANEAAFRANQRAVYHPDDPAAKHTAHTHQQPLPEPEKRQPKKDRNDRRNRRSAAGVSGGEEPKEPEEDYTQIIRTAPANGNDYAAASLAHHPGVVPAVSPGHYATERARSVHPEPATYVDQYGRPVPVSEPYRYEERERVQYVDEYGRPIEYAPPPREEVRYVDQYGRPVEVVRVVERPVYDRPVYDYPPQQHSYGPPPPGHEYGAPPPGHEYGAPPPGPEYGAPPPGYDYGPTRVGHEYARPPLEHEYGRPAEYGRERMHYVDDYGRPVPYGPPPTY